MPTYLNPNSIYGFDSASTGSVLTKGSSSSITFQNISAMVPSNVSSFTNDAGYINSGVTAMTHYATSANVVNAINDIDSVVILDGNRWANTALTPAIRYINMPAISSIKSVISDGKTPIIKFRDLKLIDGIESVYSADSVSYLMLVDYTEDNNHIIFNGVDEYNRLITLNGSRPNSIDVWSYKATELNNMAYGLFANMYMSNGVTICTRSIAEIIAAYNANLPIDIRYRYGSLNFRSYNIEVSNNVVTVHFVDEPEAQNNLIRESDYPVITGKVQTYGDEWGNFTPLILRRGLQITDLADVNLSSVTIANTVLAYDDTTNLVTKGFIVIPEPSSNLSDYINDAGFITSGVTAMTYYATSADVVNRFNSLATVVDDSIMSIDDTIYISGTGNSDYSISRTNDELYNLIVSSNTRINAVLMFKETSGSPIVPMLCKSYQKSVTNNGDNVSITFDFISTLVANSSYTLLTDYTVHVTLGLDKIYVGNHDFIGYASSISVIYGTVEVGGVVPNPMFGSTGQLVAVSSAGTYELTEATDCIGSGITPLDYCDYSYIFGLQCLSSGTIATLLYIDDFPANVISNIEAASGTLQNHIDAICNDFAYAIDCGTNICSITPEIIEYDGETYRLWRFCVYDRSGGGFEELRWFGLMSDDIDAQYLIDNSMESDITKRFCPFVAVGYFDDGFQISYPQNDNHFSLICVKTDAVFTQPTPTPNQLITDMYVDSLYRYPLPLVYNDALMSGYLTGVTDNTVSELLTHSYALYENTPTHYKLVDSVIISGNTYSMWVDNGGSGSTIGLTEPGLTFEDVFPQTIEGNLENIKLNNNPFVYMSTDINDLTTYDANGIQEVSRCTTIIRVR